MKKPTEEQLVTLATAMLPELIALGVGYLREQLSEGNEARKLAEVRAARKAKRLALKAR